MAYSLSLFFCFALLSVVIKNFKGDVICIFYSYFVAIFSEDKEIKRLVKDVEDTLETIPQLKSTFSLQAEIDLAIQPLRSENAQLRRFVQEIIVIKCFKEFFVVWAINVELPLFLSKSQFIYRKINIIWNDKIWICIVQVNIYFGEVWKFQGTLFTYSILCLKLIKSINIC